VRHEKETHLFFLIRCTRGKRDAGLFLRLEITDQEEVLMAGHSFHPGDTVIWLKNAGGDFVFPVLATVVRVTAKRVTITANDPDEKGEGMVTRHVHPANLQPHEQGTAGRAKRTVSLRQQAKKPEPAGDSFEARYPHIASWVQDGWIEMGRDDCDRSFVRALDIGGLVWEGDGPYASIDEALRALDAGIAAWLEEMS
jgi:hypothetical protein